MKADSVEPNAASYMTAIGALRFDEGVKSNAMIAKHRAKLYQRQCHAGRWYHPSTSMEWVGDKALELWEAMRALRTRISTPAYNVMIGTLSRCGRLAKVLELWDQMAEVGVER